MLWLCLGQTLNGSPTVNYQSINMFEDSEIDLETALNYDELVQCKRREIQNKHGNSNCNQRHNLPQPSNSDDDDTPSRTLGKRSGINTFEEQPNFKEPKLEPKTKSSASERPRKKSMFPGPAGIVPGSQTQDNKDSLLAFASTQRTKKSTVRDLTDANPAWQHLQHHESVANTSDSDSMMKIYNISWARDKSLRTGLTFKTPLLIGTIRSIDLNIGLDFQCELVDVTGALKCIIHRDIYEQQKDLLLLPGTVLCLRNVTIMRQSDGKVSGIITPNNLVSIYYVKNDTTGVKNVSQLTKDDVRRSAARLNRDEKTHSKLLSETINLTAMNSNTDLQPLNSGTPARIQSSFKPDSHPVVSHRHRVFSPGVTSTPMPSSVGLSLGKKLPENPNSASSLSTLPRPSLQILSTSIGRSRPSSPNISGSNLRNSLSNISLPGVDSQASLTSGSSSESNLPALKQVSAASTSSKLTKRTNLESQVPLGFAHEVKQLTEKMLLFRAPVPSPPSSGCTLKTTLNRGGSRQSQKYGSKPKFLPPTKNSFQKNVPLCTGSPLEVNPSQSEMEATQELFDGLDQDSIFGDF